MTVGISTTASRHRRAVRRYRGPADRVNQRDVDLCASRRLRSHPARLCVKVGGVWGEVMGFTRDVLARVFLTLIVLLAFGCSPDENPPSQARGRGQFGDRCAKTEDCASGLCLRVELRADSVRRRARTMANVRLRSTGPAPRAASARESVLVIPSVTVKFAATASTTTAMQKSTIAASATALPFRTTIPGIAVSAAKRVAPTRAAPSAAVFVLAIAPMTAGAPARIRRRMPATAGAAGMRVAPIGCAPTACAFARTAQSPTTAKGSVASTRRRTSTTVARAETDARWRKCARAEPAFARRGRHRTFAPVWAASKGRRTARTAALAATCVRRTKSVPRELVCARRGRPTAAGSVPTRRTTAKIAEHAASPAPRPRLVARAAAAARASV